MIIKQFAELDADNKVIRVINANSQEWCETNLNGTWVETVDGGTNNLRADIGDTYDSSNNKFIKPVIEVEEEELEV
jgi:hypothetical protein